MERIYGNLDNSGDNHWVVEFSGGNNSWVGILIDLGDVGYNCCIRHLQATNIKLKLQHK